MLDNPDPDPDSEAELAFLVALRRHLHRIPELRFQEFKTAEYLKSVVDPLADDVIDGVGGTGVFAILEGSSPGLKVLLRADMDAYPVTEASGVPYAAKCEGVAHACGHDVHMAVVVGVLQRLAKDRPATGTVHVLFQPAEEIPFGQESGARAVLDSGVLHSDYDAVLGLHCWPHLDAGFIGIDRSIAMAAKDSFKIEVIGAGAHAAIPSSGRDSVLAISELVVSLHALLARRRDPHEMVAFNVGTIAGGASQSLVPPSASVTGTLRTLDEVVRARLKETVEQVCRGFEMQHDVTINLTWADEMPALMNAVRLVDLGLQISSKLAEVVELSTPPMTADDFALLAALWPGLYVKLGIRQPGVTASPSLHSPMFTVAEECLLTGVNTLEWLTRQVLRRGSKEEQRNASEPS